MPLVLPSRMIHNRVKAYSFNGNAGFQGCDYFVDYIAKPFRPAVVFDAGFRDKDGFTVKAI